MAATNPSSSSSPQTLHPRLSNPRRLHRPCLLKLPFTSHDHKLLYVRCQIPKFEPKRSALNSDVTETTSSSSSSIDFLTLCHSLKTTKRKGWLNHGIKGPESIADHIEGWRNPDFSVCRHREALEWYHSGITLVDVRMGIGITVHGTT
ncbi:hypothetical protein L6452_02328 [Arctium lappa]|uniref:Uncharacterized protein n=1 Tax=Arctium lappa TaxID=4217 RepID=A0ACB9FJ89_ARCLA|nr:hypothetical protein L6452_02328 [Arctium lappa]